MLLVFALVAACALAVACSASGTNSKPGGAGGGAGSIDGGSDATLQGDAGPDAALGNPTTVVIGPGADKSAPGKFGGADDPSAKPKLVYPASGVIVPPNMNSLEFHFIPATGQTLFKLRFEAATLDFVVYFGCTPLGTGCVYTPDKQFWGELVKAARGTAAVKYTLSGVDGQSPGAVGKSDAHEISFTKEDINGGLYYWNTQGIIQRYDFGYPLKKAELFMNAQMAGGFLCVGCHALSRDGKTMAIGTSAPVPAAPYGIFDVATRKPVSVNGSKLSGAANFFSFSPNGTQLLYSNGAKIGWRDLTTGQIKNDNIAPGAMPDWSPGGSVMVFARPSPLYPGPGIQGGSIALMDFDQTNQVWTNPRALVAAGGGNNYYPAFDPSGNWVVYNRSPANHNSYENIGVDSKSGQVGDGELWMVNVHGGKPIRLDNATKPGAVSWPKWAPDIGTYWGGSVMWLTFSSARAYGLRLAKNQKVQLWMVAIDLDKASQGKDPSFPAFWLPFQDINGGNHIAQWVTKVARQPCTKTTDCQANETCDNGKCVPVVR